VKVITINGKKYRLPNALNPFQLGLYIHLIDWKWQHITTDYGTSQGGKYDAILPGTMVERNEWPHIYSEVRKVLRAHRSKNDFRIHPHFYHMASSQAAIINLFLPILQHPSVNFILGAIKPDLASLATDCLDNGYCIEFWGGNFDNNDFNSGNKGLLGDKSTMSGTDSDIAIAYRNHQNELCLWLIEHKLTESEFTECGGFKSKGRKAKHDCIKSFAQIVTDKHTCYYHDVRKFKYWEITEVNQQFFANHSSHASCPFRGGMNQLWRNQLLALALEQDKNQSYKHTTFSVVRHPGNNHLDESIKAFKALIDNNAMFTEFTSTNVIGAVEKYSDAVLDEWITWYRGLYRLKEHKL